MDYSKSICRQGLNRLIAKQRIGGDVLDLGANNNSDYHALLKTTTITTIDLTNKSTIAADLEQLLPIKPRTFKTIVAFNILEHVFNYQQLLKQIFLTLKPKGNFYAATPFIKNIHNNPNDFWRFTHQSLQKCLNQAGFSHVVITPTGIGPFFAIYDILLNFIPQPFRPLLWYPLLLLNNIAIKIRPSWCREYVLGYFIKASKS